MAVRREWPRELPRDEIVSDCSDVIGQKSGAIAIRNVRHALLGEAQSESQAESADAGIRCGSSLFTTGCDL